MPAPPSAAPTSLEGGAVGPSFTITFTEAGLPNGTYWTITLGPPVSLTNSSRSTAITFSLTNGTYTFGTNVRSGYSPSPSSGTFTVAGANLSIPIAWTALYNLVFSETGLPSGTTWHVYLGLLEKASRAGTTITYRAGNGTYSFNAGANVAWVPNPQNGVTSVNGTDVQVNITFSPPPPRYNITFQEVGLPNGTSWYVTVNGLTSKGTVYAPTPIAVIEPDGDYVYSVGADAPYIPHPSAGTAVVEDADQTIVIVFTPPFSTTLAFVESGLSTGNWTVAVDGNATLGPAGTAIVFAVANGTHAFVVSPLAGYTVSPSAGLVPVVGTAVTVNVTFSIVTYPLTIFEQGLGAGTWWVDVNGANRSAAAGATIALSFPSGFFTYTAGTDTPGFVARPPAGTFQVGGGAGRLVVNFTLDNGSGGVPPAGTGGVPLYLIGVAAGAGIVAIALGGALLTRRPRPSSP
ncbi:MAG TPA: hypothetical protein VMH78_05665, partial [Thermoplasmata archaeon]|nr:hypothetical protein [Thermoplasmata archaeon]